MSADTTRCACGHPKGRHFAGRCYSASLVSMDAVCPCRGFVAAGNYASVPLASEASSEVPPLVGDNESLRKQLERAESSGSASALVGTEQALQPLAEVLRARYTPTEISSTSHGVETVFCGTDEADGYIGWTTRERASREGYAVNMTPGDTDVLALLDLLSVAAVPTTGSAGLPDSDLAADLETAREEIATLYRDIEELRDKAMLDACDECNDREEAERARAEAAEARLAETQDALRNVDWPWSFESQRSYCPVCGIEKGFGHVDDCLLAALLGDDEQARKEQIPEDASASVVKAEAPSWSRLRTCVAEWPECEDGAYNPRCCRFPKQCSCMTDDPTLAEPPEAASSTEQVTPAHQALRTTTAHWRNSQSCMCMGGADEKRGVWHDSSHCPIHAKTSALHAAQAAPDSALLSDVNTEKP